MIEIDSLRLEIKMFSGTTLEIKEKLKEIIDWSPVQEPFNKTEIIKSHRDFPFYTHREKMLAIDSFFCLLHDGQEKSFKEDKNDHSFICKSIKFLQNIYDNIDPYYDQYDPNYIYSRLPISQEDRLSALNIILKHSSLLIEIID